MKSTILSLTFAATSASALHLPFTRRIPQQSSGLIPRTNTLAARAEGIKLGNGENTIYTSILNVAGKDVPVQMDTGSTDLWLYNYQSGLLDSARNYESINVTAGYAIGAVTGFLSQIDVTLAGISIANQSFINVQSSQNEILIDDKKAAGILGLAFDSISHVNNAVEGAFPGATWGRSLLTNLFLSNPTTPNHVTFRLDRLYDNNDTDTGSFNIGTFAPGFEAVNDTAPIPLFTSNSTKMSYWEVLLDAVTINGQNQTLSSTVTGDVTPPQGKLAAVLDTGYSLPQLTTQLAHDIYTSMGGVLYERDGTNSLYMVPCMAETKLAFYIGGHTIDIHPLDVTRVATQVWGDKNVTFCHGAFQPLTGSGGGSYDVILGDSFLRNVYTVWDYGDFIDGTTGSPRGNPYIKLLPLTDPTAASAEFKSARAAHLATLPPQINVSTVNDANGPQVIPGTGTNAAMRLTFGGTVAVVAAGLASVFLVV
ncbi:hypothetical protein FRC12_015902 [Ceratobasidium sp. 428]|nr:hypothetical protein FRC09_001479 [Ceratobasidium sp. 395]KAG8740722.1 hypothetical protein FRC12_015902 [Ceratobasidium sp. 428]